MFTTFTKFSDINEVFIEELFDTLKIEKIPGNWGETMSTIHTVLNTPLTFIDGTNAPTEFKLHMLLDEIRKEHYHQNVSTDKTHTGIPSRKKIKFISCSYHQESLFVHSILTMLISINRAFFQKNVSPVLAGLTGLLHDVGKPACLTQYGENLGFPFHGEYGACILSQFSSPQIDEILTKDGFATMIRAIGIHMCSYHTTSEDDWSIYRRTLAQLEMMQVKELLECLSYGDTLGKFSPLNDPSDFIKTRDSYNEFTHKKFEVKKFMQTHKFDIPCFFVRGTSGSGKTYFIKNMLIPFLSTYFNPSQFTLVSRDEIMAKITASRISHTLTQSRPIGEEYQMLYAEYKLRKLGKVVNDEMRKTISILITEGKIPIVDSCILYYDGIIGCIPDNMNRAFIIAVDIVRNTVYTEDDSFKNGMSLMDTVKTNYASRTILTPLPPSINLTSLAAVSTHSNKPETKWIPQLCFVNGFNQNSSIGFDTFTKTIEPIMSYFSETLESTDTDSMNIVSYVNFLYKKFGYEGMRETLVEQAYHALDSHKNKRILRLKYLDHNNRWRPMWSRHTRGTTFYLNDDDVWVPLKYLLQRGCEMMTGIQVKNGIDSTESFNLDGSSLDEKINSAISSTLDFDENQRKTILSLLLNREIEGGMTLSFKKDGSLLGYTIIRDAKTQEFMRNFIEESSDEFAKLIMNMCDTLCIPFGFFSSQSTLLIGSDMLDWTVQSLLSTIMTDDEIAKYSNHSYMEMVKEKFSEILINLSNLSINAADKLNFPKTSTITLNMETICKDRRSVFGKKEHTELALSYSSTSCTVLGLSMCSSSVVKNMPHFTFSEFIKANGFVEPCYWKISHTDDVNSILNDLNDVIFEKISVNDFFSKNPPHNLYKNWEKIIDREGFVTFTGASYDYGKIKTDAYYIAHKLKSKNIEYLMNLSKIPSACSAFPLCNEVKVFYSNLEKDLRKIEGKFNEMCQDTLSHLYLGLPEKARVSFQRQTPYVRVKMLINASDSFSECVVSIFGQVYPFNKSNVPEDFIENVTTIMKSILMSFAGNFISFDNLAKSEVLGELFGLVRKAIQSIP
jgi:hypothetical protein